MPAYASRHNVPEPDPCPVSEDMLGRLYRSGHDDLAGIVSTLPEIQRARLAVFCYGRAHLSDMGRVIASTCDHQVLVDVADQLGSVLYAQSRHLPAAAAAAVPWAHRKVTLASRHAPAALPQGFDELQDNEPEAAPEPSLAAIQSAETDTADINEFEFALETA